MPSKLFCAICGIVDLSQFVVNGGYSDRDESRWNLMAC